VWLPLIWVSGALAGNVPRIASADDTAPPVAPVDVTTDANSPLTRRNARQSVSEVAVQSGLEARRQGDDAQALAFFEAAERLAPTPRVQAQIGLAHQALGHWLQAEEALSSALEASSDQWIEYHHLALTNALGVVHSHLAWLVVRSNVMNATLSIPGVPTAKLNSPVRVPSGTLLVSLSAPGHLPRSTTVVVQPQATATETVELQPSANSPPASQRPQPETRSGQRTPVSHRPERLDLRQPTGWLMLGLGAAALGYSAFSGIRTLHLKSERDQQCSTDGCSETGVLLDDQARDAAVASTVSATLGVLLVGGGTLLLVVGRPQAAPPLPSTASTTPKVIGWSISAEYSF